MATFVPIRDTALPHSGFNKEGKLHSFMAQPSSMSVRNFSLRVLNSTQHAPLIVSALRHKCGIGCLRSKSWGRCQEHLSPSAGAPFLPGPEFARPVVFLCTDRFALVCTAAASRCYGAKAGELPTAVVCSMLILKSEVCIPSFPQVRFCQFIMQS